jgi:dTDP-4-dehydrorhamnose 3,5-epimerase-like enzyme
MILSGDTMIEKQKISGLLKITLPKFEDDRGKLMEVFHHLTFPNRSFAIRQVNYIIKLDVHKQNSFSA